MAEPWADWLPGVLSPEQVMELESAGFLYGTKFHTSPPEGSAFNLHITESAWHLPGGAVKPDAATPYNVFLKRFGNQVKFTDNMFSLERNNTYVFELSEHLQLPKNSGIHGQATARSSVGRMDVLARLIVDGMNGYEGFNPTDSLRSKMYVEVTPMTFPVRVRAGHSLSQLRLFYGAPEQCVMRGKELARTIRAEDDNLLHIDLTPVEIEGQKTVAFRAKPNAVINKTVDLWEGEGAYPPDPCDYWMFCTPDDQQRLRLEQNVFYIFRSREHLALPGGVAAYCRASDETIGEMRIHYAGFVHPWFGRNRDDGETGTPLIFEVRGHDLSVNLRHNEVLARMAVYRMSRDVPQPQKRSRYDKQELKLSGFFGKWPPSLYKEKDGSVRRK
jgi:dCTP deaminase